MFETSPNNKAVLNLYEATDKPYSYSITPEIYRLLPNGTDFTVFLEMFTCMLFQKFTFKISLLREIMITKQKQVNWILI